MQTGWLVVNQFLSTQKFTEHYDFLRRAAEKMQVQLELKTAAELLHIVGEPFLQDFHAPDFVLFWDKDVRLAMALERMGLKVFNKARAIWLCDDKSLTQLALSGQVPMPKTICAPMTYPAVGYTDLTFVKQAVKALGLPLVIKECFGSFGAQVYLVHSLQEAEALATRLCGVPFLFQEFIASSHGRDVRLQVVGNQVVAAMLRYNETGDFRANITGGANMRAYHPTLEQERLALLACERLGLDFAGVDFLFGPADEPILCEINSNAHFKNLFTCTGVNVAEAILQHIVSKTKGQR